jgi:serpin B
MMQQSTNFNYYQTNGYQAVELPYQGTNLAMYVFVPDSTSSLEELLGATSGPWWQQTVDDNFSMQPGTITLPKFNLNYKVGLVEPLQALGMVTAFTDFADFSGISRDGGLKISDVTQQAIVEVNEEGTVATAVTTISVIATVVAVNPPFEMIVNRPFLFVIQDQQAGTILFMGAVFNP